MDRYSLNRNEICTRQTQGNTYKFNEINPVRETGVTEKTRFKNGPLSIPSDATETVSILNYRPPKFQSYENFINQNPDPKSPINQSPEPQSPETKAKTAKAKKPKPDPQSPETKTQIP